MAAALSTADRDALLRRIAHQRRLRLRIRLYHARPPVTRQPIGTTRRTRRAEVDRRPGRYYVCARSGAAVWLLLGPFRRHRQARRFVQAARAHAIGEDHWAWFYSHGTAKLPDGWQGPVPLGKYNAALGIAPSARKAGD